MATCLLAMATHLLAFTKLYSIGLHGTHAMNIDFEDGIGKIFRNLGARAMEFVERRLV